MNTKKILALLVCACMLLVVLTGCGGGTQVVEYTDDEIAESAANTADTAAAADEDAVSIGQGGTGAAAYPLDTVVATVNGDEVTWEEYYYWLSYYVGYSQSLAAQYNFVITDWDGADLAEGMTNAEAIIASAQYAAAQYHIYEQEAASNEITAASGEIAEQVDEIIASNADSYYGDGDGETASDEMTAMEEAIAESGVTTDLLRYQTAVNVMNAASFTAQYGENGENYPDDAVMQFIEDNSIMNAKHILLLTVDPDTGEALSDEEIAEKQALIADLMVQLQEVQDDPDALNELFDELMNEYSEDTGLETYPDGYIFAPGDMIESFEDAVLELDENYGLSDIVQSEYGYHIILRMPVTPDDTYVNVSSGYAYTLRDLAASNDFTTRLTELQEAADIQWYDEYTNLDMMAIFG